MKKHKLGVGEGETRSIDSANSTPQFSAASAATNSDAAAIAPSTTTTTTTTTFDNRREPHIESCWQTRCKWLLPAFIVFYSIVKEIKVGEPFMFKYQTETLGFTSFQLKSIIYPWYPYGYLIIIIPVFLLTDLLCYKPSMILEILGQLGYRTALVFGTTVTSQIIGLFCIGAASASEIAFFSYTYARLEKAQYQRLTSWTRAGTMLGRTAGYAASQVIILAHLGNYRTLNIIALIIPCFVLVLCIIMPSVKWQTMVARMLEVKEQARRLSIVSATPKQIAVDRPTPQNYCQYVRWRVRSLYSDFIKIYSSSYIRRWSFWWAITTCMSLQVALLSQTLWGEVQTATQKESPYNGFAEAGYTLVSALSILALNKFNVDWDKFGEATLVIISIIDASILVAYAQAQTIWAMYPLYIAYRSLYQVMITIAQWNIAKKMVCESYGLVFGANMFASLILQCLLTAIVTDAHGPLAMGIREQYMLYGACHIVIAIVFLISIIHTCALYFIRRRRQIADESRARGQIYEISSPPPLVTSDSIETKRDAIAAGVNFGDSALVEPTENENEQNDDAESNKSATKSSNTELSA